MENKAYMMQATVCERHSGAHPGGGVCAVCLQERLFQLWRGEGNANWDKEEYSVTPPPMRESCETPPVCEPSPGPEAHHPHFYKGLAPCFPLGFRVRNLQRDDVHESSKSSKGLEREKIDRSCFSGMDSDGEHEHQFSCEMKSIMKELAALHDKKRAEKGVKKRLGSDNASILVQRQQEEETVDVAQEPVSLSSGTKDTIVAPAEAELLPPKSCTQEEDDDEEDDRYQKEPLCFSAWRPGYLRAKLNLKWAKVLTSPIMSSNKIAPSKSDLLSKTTQSRPKIVIEKVRQHGGRDSETSRVLLENDDAIGRIRSPAHQLMPSPDVAPLPPVHRQVQLAPDEDGIAPDIDEETAMRMEASRIAVMTWLQSLPSPKTAYLTVHDPHELPDNLSLGNGVLEMCDDEEVELDYQTRDLSFYNSNIKSTDVSNQISSFGKFLLGSPQHQVATPFIGAEMAVQ